MNRNEIMLLENAGARRTMQLDNNIEFRAAANDSLQFAGYASVTEYPYAVYPDSPIEFEETIARGAFKKTLAEGADVNFLINHEGITLARTKSGTLTLLEDDTGLRTLADLDPKNPDVQRLQSAIDRRDIDEMSFGFRVTRDEWTDDRGEPSNRYFGTKRRIHEVSLHKGDVSAVNYGASDVTSGSFRDIDRALMHFRSGAPLTNEERTVIRDLAASFDEVPASEPQPTIIDALLAELERLEHA